MRLIKILILIAVLVWAAALAFPDANLHLVFCDVGQGDAIFAYRGRVQLLVDGGPGDKVLDCLARHMPFWDREIEVVVATHPDRDHIGGLPSVFKRYRVIHFVSVPIGKGSGAYEALLVDVRNEGAKVSNVYTGDTIGLGEIWLDVVWPERQWAAERIKAGSERWAGEWGEGGVLGASSEGETNDFSIAMILKYGDFEAFLTGDADARILPNQLSTGRLREVEVLKVPHHGSKTGMTKEWLEAVFPRLAVISVGKNNRYGHPSAEAISLLEEMGIRWLRTDVEGEVEVVTTGSRWWVK